MRHLRLPITLTKADAPTAIMGGWDGAISVLAVVVALAVGHHVTEAAIAGTAGAVGGTFSMGTGQWVSDGDTYGRRARLRRATVMAASTGAGGVIPVLPFYAGLAWWVATTAAVALAFALATLVAVTKARTAATPRPVGAADLATDYALLLATAAATYAVGLL